MNIELIEIGIATIIVIIIGVWLLKSKEQEETPKKQPKKEQLKKKFTKAEYLGMLGELEIEEKLQKLNEKLNINGKISRNVYIHKGNGETTEIDIIYITKYGVFVIESKNYSGWIFGDEKYTYWIVSYNKDRQERLYNPVRQNNNHIKALRKTISNKNVRYYNVIIFSYDTEIKEIKIKSGNTYVINLHDLESFLIEITETREETLNEKEIKEIYKTTQKYTMITEAERNRHKQRIREKYK